MASVIKIFWYLSFGFVAISLVLAYGYLPKDMILYGFDTAMFGKATFFNTSAIILALFFFAARIFQKGIREMNWAFVFPLSKKWLIDAESRDKYRSAIEAWLTGIFAVTNFIFLFILMLIWGGNDAIVYSYNLVFFICLIISITVLILILVIPPLIIYKGPSIAHD